MSHSLAQDPYISNRSTVCKPSTSHVSDQEKVRANKNRLSAPADNVLHETFKLTCGMSKAGFTGQQAGDLECGEVVFG